MQEAIHPGDGGGHQIPLLPEQLERSPFLPLPPKLGHARQEHAAGAAGRIVDRLTWLWLEQFGHQMDDGSVGVELGSRMARIVGELLDEIFVTNA